MKLLRRVQKIISFLLATEDGSTSEYEEASETMITHQSSKPQAVGGEGAAKTAIANTAKHRR